MRGIHWLPVDSPHKGDWLKALMFSLMCAWQTVEQTLELLVTWDAMMSMWCHSNEWWHHNQLRNALWDLAIVTQAHKKWKKCPHAPAILMSGCQSSKHGDVTDLSRATCDVYGRKLDIKRSVNIISVPIKRERSKDCRQGRFLLFNALLFFIKLRFLKLHFYLNI